MVPTLPKQAAKPVVPTLPVVQVNVPLLGVAATIEAVRGSNSATPLTIPTLPVVQVNVPLLSRTKPNHDAIAAALVATVPSPPALTPLNVPLSPLNLPLTPQNVPLQPLQQLFALS